MVHIVVVNYRFVAHVGDNQVKFAATQVVDAEVPLLVGLSPLRTSLHLHRGVGQRFLDGDVHYLSFYEIGAGVGWVG